MNEDYSSNPLVKQVPGQLFSFEEKVFGVMSLSQLLSDLGVLVGILSLTGSLALVARVEVALCLLLPSLFLIHGRIQGQSLVSWLYLVLRFRFIARHTTWQSLEDLAQRSTKASSIQRTWIPLDSLEHGIMGYAESGAQGAAGRYWTVLECEGRHVRYLPESEQIKQFERFETFLCGLEFRLQFVSLVEQVDAAHYRPLAEQREALALLEKTPRLRALQEASLLYQEKHLQHCTLVRHFVIVAATAQEVAAKRDDGEKKGVFSVLWKSLSRSQQGDVTREQVVEQLRIRVSVVQKLLQQLDVKYRLLEDAELLQQFVQCLAPGMTPPSFTPRIIREASEAALTLATAPTHATSPTASGVSVRVPSHGDGANGGAGRSLHSNKVRRRTYKKMVKGLHGACVYTSKTPQARFEAHALRLADLVAPSSITITPDTVEETVWGRKRFSRYVEVRGYGSQLLCGYTGDFTELGLPLSIALSFEPIENQYMINRLEMQLVRLESRQLADKKALRIGRASRTVEAEQIRAVTRALAARRMKVYAVQMTIGVHAGSRDHLEQRTRYLLSHLRQKQLKVRTAFRRQDTAWQATLPICPVPQLDATVNLPSDVLSSFLNFSTGGIGTPTGAFLGFTGSGSSRRTVYFNPWSLEKRIANPHMCIIGETGQGKSFDCKVLVTGLMGMGIADVVVLDRDDDYLSLHQYLQGESQRFNLARGCPINLFDLPFAPTDVDPDDPSDMLAEFLDNALLAGLTLLLCDANERLSKIEEAYLMFVARQAYAKQGITSEAIRSNPDTLLLPMPTLYDFIATMRETPASSEAMKQSLIERLEKATYLFSGQTRVSLDKPLTIFSIHDLDEKWYALMTFTVQNFLMRHRALRRDERYLAYVVEEASYMLKHPAGRKYLETGSRGFRKLGIAQITLSQHPREFLTEGAVILNNCGAACYLGMQSYAAQELHLAEELERTITAAIPGQIVMRVGNEYAAVHIATSPLHRRLFSTTPQENRKQRQKRSAPASSSSPFLEGKEPVSCQ